MSVILSALRATVRRQITLATTWPDETLDGWLGDAVRDYSREFPRRLRKILTLTTGTQAYNLPGGQAFLNILQVEYPAGQSPPIMLWQSSKDASEFQNGGYAYALQAPVDSTAPELDVAAGQIVFAQTVTTGQTAAIEYEALHSVPAIADDDAIITVPDVHHELLIAFVEFRQAAQLNNDARWRQCIANDKLSELSSDSRWTWERYTGLLKELRATAPRLATGGNVTWHDIGLENAPGRPYRWR